MADKGIGVEIIMVLEVTFKMLSNRGWMQRDGEKLWGLSIPQTLVSLTPMRRHL